MLKHIDKYMYVDVFMQLKFPDKIGIVIALELYYKQSKLAADKLHTIFCIVVENI